MYTGHNFTYKKVVSIECHIYIHMYMYVQIIYIHAYIYIQGSFSHDITCMHMHSMPVVDNLHVGGIHARQHAGHRLHESLERMLAGRIYKSTQCM